MPTMSKSRVALIDYMKGISIFGIVLFHLIHEYMTVPGLISKASTYAGAGIHIFNLCSSFGLTLSFIKKPVNWKDFIRKRFIKIYIPYAIAITLYFIFSKYTYEGDNALLAYLSHILLYKMFIPEYMTSFGGHFWYISTIFQFYFVFLMLMKLRSSIGSKKLLIVSCVISVLWITFTSITGKVDNRVWNNCILQYIWQFSLGIYLADLFCNRNNSEPRQIPIMPIVLVTAISIIIYGATGLIGGFWKNYNDVFALLSIGGIYYLLYQIKPVSNIFTRLSVFSYELYLLHILVFDILFTILAPYISNLLIALIALVLAFVTSYCYSIFTKKLIKTSQ